MLSLKVFDHRQNTKDTKDRNQSFRTPISPSFNNNPFPKIMRQRETILHDARFPCVSEPSTYYAQIHYRLSVSIQSLLLQSSASGVSLMLLLSSRSSLTLQSLTSVLLNLTPSVQFCSSSPFSLPP